MKINVFKSIILISLLIAGCRQKPSVQVVKDTWYKNLLIYNLDVKTFKDSNGDGMGDFKGLTARLDYLKDLGVGIIWLAPFQPSPLQDDGYDVSDYYSIDPKLGSPADLKVFMAAAKQRRMHVIMDLVLNHSSTMHPWYLQATKDSSSPKRSWYLWARERPKDWNKGMGFPKVETATWDYNSTAKAYYFHRFYRFEPDLNYQNPDVFKESKKILGYWLDMGMDGFRLDAVPFMIDDPRQSSDKPKFDFTLLHRMAAFVKKQKPGVILLGEANVEPKENKDYFDKKNDGLEMMFNFYVNQYLFYALATGDGSRFKKALTETREKPAKDQWAFFLRNHDEIDLGRLSKGQMKEVNEAMGPDTNMLLYGRGIRRRLAPMLNNDIRRLKMAYSLLFALPGTPVIRNGEEIGMGDDLRLKERLSVRTPMQWDTGKNAGFSDAAEPFRPVIHTGAYTYKKINVAVEDKDPASLLNFLKKMIIVRKQHPQIGYTNWSLPDTGSDQLFAILYEQNGRRLLLCYNFDHKQKEGTIKVGQSMKSNVLELISNQRENVSSSGEGLKIKIGPYGYKWYSLN